MLPHIVRDNLEKCRAAAIAAVDAYNRPGLRFRTAQFIVLITIAWTALFHAIFYRRKRRPWYRKRTKGKAIRYVKVDDEPKHWELAQCLKEFYGERATAERKNLEFLIGLRNKIEHRHLPALDSSLYGECQAALLNLEQLLTEEFGERYALAEQLAISLQFSHILPEEKARATRTLVSGRAKSVREYVERFRSSLEPAILNSQKYSFTVFLVPRVANRASIADAAVQFVRVDEASAEELERLEKLNVLIREKHIPIANLNLYKPGEVVEELESRLPWRLDLHVHTRAWKYYAVRPSHGGSHPERTRSEYCIYDQVHEDYVYTKAWIDKLAADLASEAQFMSVVGRPADRR